MFQKQDKDEASIKFAVYKHSKADQMESTSRYVCEAQANFRFDSGMEEHSASTLIWKILL